MTQQFSFPPLFLGWLIAMLLSVSTGSATVGIVGTAGLLAPVAASDPNLNLPLLALSIGCGSLFFNYANHAGFWLLKESFGSPAHPETGSIVNYMSIRVGTSPGGLIRIVSNGPCGRRTHRGSRGHLSRIYSDGFRARPETDERSECLPKTGGMARPRRKRRWRSIAARPAPPIRIIHAHPP